MKVGGRINGSQLVLATDLGTTKIPRGIFWSPQLVLFPVIPDTLFPWGLSLGP